MASAEMKVLHVSPIYNRQSIFRYGIIPTHVRNENHRDRFIEDGVATKDGRAVYTWLDSEMNEKLVRDLIYAIVWIHPRNDLGDLPGRDTYNDPIDFRYFHRRPIYPYKQMPFDVYLAESDKTESDYVHQQEPANNIDNTCYNMHEEYAHDFKELVIHDKPLTKVKIIGSAMYYYNQPHGSLSIKILC